MAVNLVRAGIPEDCIDDDTLPIIEIQSKEVKPPPCFKGKVTGRTSETLTNDGYRREVVCQQNYARRHSQLTESGFHGSPAHKYKDVGEVVLNDSSLILQAIGQDKRRSAIVRSLSRKSDLERSVADNGPCGPPALRSKTPSQFPDQLKSLHKELKHSNDYLSKIRKGHGLFQLIEQEKLMTIKSLEAKEILEREKNDLGWNEATDSRSSIEMDPSQFNNEEQSESSEEVQMVHRMLCVILWILDGMKLESPVFMPALGTYWKITRPQAIHGKRLYERQQLILKKWDEISANVHIQDESTSLVQQRRVVKRDANARPLTPGEKLKVEMETIREQKYLTPEQIEKLKVLVDEELNKSKKKARQKIKKLMEESALKYKLLRKSSASMKSAVSVRLNAEQSRISFGKVDESRGMIIHEQLVVMSRDRKKALEQRFSSFTVSQGLWKDIGNMRSGVEIESTIMAHNKLMMNYNWMCDLRESLSEAVLKNRYCIKILDNLSMLEGYMKQVGPSVMSQKKLIQVLSVLHPWQLESPEVLKAIKFIIEHVIYIVPEDFWKWMEYTISN